MRGQYALVWWSRRSYLEKGLMYALLTSFFILFLVLIFATKKPSILTGGKSGIQNVCRSADCVHIASRILDDMDTSVEPCDNFYKFACGGFLKRETIPDDSVRWGNYERLRRKVTEELRHEMESRTIRPEARVVTLMKSYYQTCMNTRLMRDQGVLPFKNLIELVGGWPVLRGPRWDNTSYQWNQTIAFMRQRGMAMHTFFTLRVAYDLKDTSKRMIHIDQPILGHPHAILSQGLNNTIVRAYYNLMINVAVKLGAEIMNATSDLYDVVQFEINLAKMSTPPKIHRPYFIYNKLEIRELDQKYPHIPWLSYIKSFLPPNQDIFIDEGEEVNLVVPEYIDGLNKLLKTTPKKVLANYAVWRFVYSFLPYLTDDMYRIYSKYLMAMNGNIAPVVRWKLCIRALMRHMPTAVGAVYVRKFFRQDLKGKVENMIVNIRDEFKKLIAQANWMDEKTRKHALEKLAALELHVGYPVELLDHKKVDDHYKDVAIGPGNFMQSLLNLTVFHTDYAFGLLRKPVNRTDWVRHSASFVVNAFYAPIENGIYVHAGILQGMFYNPDRQKYLNYGKIGTTVSHEMVHGYDHEGRLRDKKGNFIEWWNTDTKKNFLPKSNCIKDQFGNYTVPELQLNINGAKTLRENMADIVGIKIAYYAYKEWLKKHQPESQLPGLNFTNEQMFWISAAHRGCAKFTLQQLRQIVMSDACPYEYRIIGTLVNSADFSRDFKCLSGSPMNPPAKCVVW